MLLLSLDEFATSFFDKSFSIMRDSLQEGLSILVHNSYERVRRPYLYDHLRRLRLVLHNFVNSTQECDTKVQRLVRSSVQVIAIKEETLIFFLPHPRSSAHHCDSRHKLLLLKFTESEIHDT